jgi:hypothetical protein
MSCPITAGAAVLLREYLVRHQSHQPSAALVKALLINGATPLRGQYRPSELEPVPNQDVGWGVINLREVLQPVPPRRVWFHDRWQDTSESLSTGEDASFTIMITERAEALKVTLVWTDAPATSGAGQKLRNDLDLEVIAPDGSRHTGNEGLYASGHACAREEADGTKWDQCNNAEGLILELPALGQYQIRIIAHNVAQGPQDYALVVSGAFTGP